eukprot:PhF_6_TR26090/c0_g1_i1/m.36849/K11838/USP7, UBP15; ubiquitin carboxyl-terminal hydrolase 7
MSESLNHVPQITGCTVTTAEGPILSMLASIPLVRSSVLRAVSSPSTAVEYPVLLLSSVMGNVELCQLANARRYFEALEDTYESATNNPHDVLVNVLKSCPEIGSGLIGSVNIRTESVGAIPVDIKERIAANKASLTVPNPSIVFVHGMNVHANKHTGIPMTLSPEDSFGSEYVLAGVVMSSMGHNAYAPRAFGYYGRDPGDFEKWVQYTSKTPLRASVEDLRSKSYEIQYHALVYYRVDAVPSLTSPSSLGFTPENLVQIQEQIVNARELELTKQVEKLAPDQLITITLISEKDVANHTAHHLRGICIASESPAAKIVLPKVANVSDVTSIARKRLDITRGVNVRLWSCTAAKGNVLPKAPLDGDSQLGDAFLKYGKNVREEVAYEGIVFVETVNEKAMQHIANGSTCVFLKWYELATQKFTYLGIRSVEQESTLESLEYDVLELMGATTYKKLKAEKETAVGHSPVDFSETMFHSVLTQGDVVVFMDDAGAAGTTFPFPSASAYVKSIENKVTITLRDANTDDALGTLSLTKDMTYPEVQSKVGEKLGVSAEYVRLIAFDGLKKCPDFANVKNKPSSHGKLESLLTSPHASETLNFLYVEKSDEKVSVLDTMEPFVFEVYDQHMNKATKFPKRVFYKSTSSLSGDQLLGYVRAAVGTTLPGPLRIVHIVQGIIENVIAEDGVTRENSLYINQWYQYRVEPLPQKESDSQTLVDCFFYHKVKGQMEKGEPFSLYVSGTDTPVEFWQRVAKRLQRPVPSYVPVLYTVPRAAHYYQPEVIATTATVVSAVKAARGYNVHVGIEFRETTPLPL